MNERFLLLTDGQHDRKTALVAELIRREWSLTVSAYDAAGVAAIVRGVGPSAIFVERRRKDSDWFESLLALRMRFPDIPMGVHGLDDDRTHAAVAVLLGAACYLTRTAAPKVVVDAVMAIAVGDFVWPADELRRAAEALSDPRSAGKQFDRWVQWAALHDFGHRSLLRQHREKLASAMLRYADSDEDLRTAIAAARELGMGLSSIQEQLDVRDQVRESRSARRARERCAPLRRPSVDADGEDTQSKSEHALAIKLASGAKFG